MSKAKLPWERRHLSFIEEGRHYFVFPLNSADHHNDDALRQVPEEVREAHERGELELVEDGTCTWSARLVLRSVTPDREWPRVAAQSNS